LTAWARSVGHTLAVHADHAHTPQRPLQDDSYSSTRAGVADKVLDRDGCKMTIHNAPCCHAPFTQSSGWQARMPGHWSACMPHGGQWRWLVVQAKGQAMSCMKPSAWPPLHAARHHNRVGQWAGHPVQTPCIARFDTPASHQSHCTQNPLCAIRCLAQPFHCTSLLIGRFLMSAQE
jgi:hypothetical protein